ncbi:DJ-1/PfpI family protein [Flavobacterium sp. UMI-01]|uniref:DJ-1/PfpI family protein n=1 Tax=Flavobacterium sp. UMI-01 TaxID=1441053 RepID=UPI001C7DA4C5|nr:DJ-1/PfpI family protein [Flavobacterium sp. UMI-01]GIZ09039.1 transcriptional regulator [Flavobacterium sp. UMI-01]
MKLFFNMIIALMILIGNKSFGQNEIKKRSSNNIEVYSSRFGRSQPVVAVLAMNEGTELSDFIIPYGILARSGTAKMVSVSVKPGTVRMSSLQFKLQNTIAEFDTLYPEGADFVIIPAVRDDKNIQMLSWIKEQEKKGSTIVSICIGVTVAANTGLLNGHSATTYFRNIPEMKKSFPNVKWQENIRYVADGKMITSAGISASIPLSLALVEAIAGYDKAIETAKKIGVQTWSSNHNSDMFLKLTDKIVVQDNVKKEPIALNVKNGDDEIAIGLVADALLMTGKASVQIVSKTSTPIKLACGLEIFPSDSTESTIDMKTVPSLQNYKSIEVLDKILDKIAQWYGKESAAEVAITMEYPVLTKYISGKN